MITTYIDIYGNTTTVDDGIPAEIKPPSPEVVAAQAISDEISSRMDDAATLSEVKLAITEGLNAALIQLQGE